MVVALSKLYVVLLSARRNFRTYFCNALTDITARDQGGQVVANLHIAAGKWPIEQLLRPLKDGVL
jgi:hypothetical protein